ncbi:MAG: hypothetical protein V3T86_07565 [Planctomycetota bacterium]
MIESLCRALCVLVLASAAAGEPHVRWIDETGVFQRAPIEAVLADTPDHVRVRLRGDKERTIPAYALVALVRERLDDPDEKRLLEIRVRVQRGEVPEGADALLAGLDQPIRPDWMRETVAATRALLAANRDDPKSLQPFLDRYPASRFRAPILRARARLADPGDGDLWDPYEDAYVAMLRAKASYIEIGRLFRDLGVRIISADPGGYDTFAGALEKKIATAAPKDGRANKVAWAMFSVTIRKWAQLDFALFERADMKRQGVKPRSLLRRFEKILDGTRLLLPELRCDAARELGITHLLCDDKNAAAGAFAIALDSAPDPVRREEVERLVEKAK